MHSDANTSLECLKTAIKYKRPDRLLTLAVSINVCKTQSSVDNKCSSENIV